MTTDQEITRRHVAATADYASPDRQLAVALARLSGQAPESPADFLRSAGDWLARKVSTATQGELAQQDDPEAILRELLAELEELQTERYMEDTETRERVLQARAASSAHELARRQREQALRASVRTQRARVRIKESRGIDRSTADVRRSRRSVYAVVALVTAVVLAFVWLGSAQGSGSAGSTSSATSGASGTASVTPSAASKAAPALTAAAIPPGFVEATKVGTLDAVVRDSVLPLNAPETVALWQRQIEQLSGDPRIIGPGNYNIFASSSVTKNVGFGSQAYLYQAILTGSGGNPRYYHKFASGAVLEGLIPLSPATGKRIAAEIGIAFNPYGHCDPTLAVQPVTCGTYSSLLIAARYINDIGATLSADPSRFAAYKAQATKGLANSAGIYLPITKLSDITCVWQKLAPRSAQCDLAAAAAYAWRRGTLIVSQTYREMMADKNFAQLLAQAKAELVREGWLK